MSGSETRRRAGVVVLTVLVVLAGCSGAGGGGGAGASVAQESTGVEGGDGAGAPEKEADAGGSGGDALQIRERRIIRTGQVSLRVENFDRARRNLTAAARDMNGFVSDSSRRRHEVRAGSYVTGSLTVRVPRERFGAMMDRAESTGTLQSSSVQSKDVTDQLVDIEARLKNLRAERERLRSLYERANDTEAVLKVQQRLSETQERIERLEARKQALERRVAYSTVRIELREERPEPGPDEIRKWYDVPLVGAFLESVHGVVVVVRAASVLAAYALPYLLAFGAPPVLVGAVAYRRWRGRHGPLLGGDEGGGLPPDGDADGDEGGGLPPDGDADGDEGDAGDGEDADSESADGDADDGEGTADEASGDSADVDDATGNDDDR